MTRRNDDGEAARTMSFPIPTSQDTSSGGNVPDDQASLAHKRDVAMRALMVRLARPHPSGGGVVERASLLAEGADFTAALAWIEANGGRPEHDSTPRAARGLHSPRLSARAGERCSRFVLPAAALR